MPHHRLTLSLGQFRRIFRRGSFRTCLIYFVLLLICIHTPLLQQPLISKENGGGGGAEAAQHSDSERSRPSPRILLVSALFPLEHSKHTHEDYELWLADFLGPHGIDCDIYFYTTPSLQPLVESLHKSANHKHTLTINTTFTTPFDVPPLAPYKTKYEQMHGWDRERDIHNPELYAVWNAKPWLLYQALVSMSLAAVNDDSNCEYDYAFWNDAGSFRDHHAFGTWPDPDRVDDVFKMASRELRQAKHELVFFPLLKLPERQVFGNWTADKGPVDMDFSEGSFFGATPAGVAWFANVFYAYHNYFISTAPPVPADKDGTESSRGRHPHARPKQEALSTPAPSPPPFYFVGKDQTLYNALLFLYPSRFFGAVSPLRINDLPVQPHIPLPLFQSMRRWFSQRLMRTKLRLGDQCVDEWFYYQWWLAGKQERKETEIKRAWRSWSDSDSGPRWFGILRSFGRIFQGEEGCGEETPLVSALGLLEAIFGVQWIEAVELSRISVER